MNKSILDAVITYTEKNPQKVLESMLNSGGGVEIIERKFDDYCDYMGILYFKISDKYFSIPFQNYSYGEGSYRFDEIKEVKPKTKEVIYFE